MVAGGVRREWLVEVVLLTLGVVAGGGERFGFARMPTLAAIKLRRRWGTRFCASSEFLRRVRIWLVMALGTKVAQGMIQMAR